MVERINWFKSLFSFARSSVALTGADIKEIYLSMFSLRIAGVLIAKGIRTEKEKRVSGFLSSILNLSFPSKKIFFGAAILEPVYKS